MYKSPIEMLITDIQHQIVKQQDEEIYKAVCHYVPNVDREELIRALKYDRYQYEKGYLDGKVDAAPKWIPVTERLPEIQQRVLVYCESKTIRKHVTACTYMGGYLGSKQFSRHVRNVTHWMPLPEPPNCGADMRGEEDENKI